MADKVKPTFRCDVFPIALEDTKHELDVDVGCVIADMLPADKHVVVGVNNRIIPIEEYETCEPIEGDYVVLRVVPTGIVVGAITAIASAVSGLAAAGVFGATFLGLAASTWAWIGVAITIVGGLIQRSLIEPPKTPESLPNPDRLPGISGQSNRIDPFGVIDCVYGRMRTVPKLGAKPYTEIIGDDQVLRMLLVVGHGPLDISDIKIGNTPLSNYQDYTVHTHNSFDWRTDSLHLYKGVVNQIAVGVQLDDTNSSATRTLSAGVPEASLDIVLPIGLANIELSSGDLDRLRVEFSLQISKTGANNWSYPTITGYYGDIYAGGVAGNDANTHVTGRTRDTIRVGLRFSVPTDDTYDVRLTRRGTYSLGGPSNPHNKDHPSKAKWTVLRSIDAGTPPIQYDGPLAIIELMIKATDQLNGIIDNLSCIAESQVVIPGTGRAKTANPAWLFRDVLTGNSAGTTVASSMIADLTNFAQFCDDRNYEFNAVVNPSDRFSVLSQILSFGRGSIDLSNGQFGVIYEHEQPAQQLFTPRNSWDFSGNRSYPKIPHALRTQYIDPGTWERNEVVVYQDGYNRNTATKYETFDVSYGCTNMSQARRIAQEKMREAALRPEGFKLTCDLEHLVSKRGSRVKHSHDAILIGLGSARITGINGDDLTFDQTFEMAAGKNYGVEVRDDTSGLHTLPVIEAAGIWDTVTLEATPPAAIKVGDLVAFGETEKITQDLIIKSIDPGGEGEATLTLIPYAPAIYNVNQPLPPYDANITQPVDIKNLPPAKPSIETVRSDEGVLIRNTDGSLSPRIVIICQYPSGNDVPIGGKQVQYREKGTVTWKLATFDRNEAISLTDVTQGLIYEIRIRSASPWNRYSAWIHVEEKVIGKSTPPPDVTGFRAEFEKYNVRLNWDNVNVIDVSRYVLEQKKGGVWQPLDIVDALTFLIDVLPAAGTASKTYEFRIKAQDSTGNVSLNWVQTSITVESPEPPTVTSKFDGADFVLMWQAPAAQFPINRYVVRRDGVIVDEPKTNVYRMKADWGGDETWSVSAVDVAENEGLASVIVATITDPKVSQQPSQIIGNNILLYWTGTPGSLPIEYYEIRVGDTLAGSVLQGTADTTFFTLFESQAGTFTYWIVAVDTAGNKSNGSPMTNGVTKPGGYTLYSQFVNDFEIDLTTTQTLEGVVQSVATLTNGLLEHGAVVMPIDTTETVAQHFTSNSWASPQDQITAGYPIYIQPTTTTAQLIQEYDCGVVVPGSKISVQLNKNIVTGTFATPISLEVKENAGDPWTSVGTTPTYTTNFRYIRVTIDVTGNDDKALLRLESMKTLVSVENITERGTLQVTANPTTLSGLPFIDITTVSVNIADGSQGYAAADWSTPDSVDFYAWDLNGNPMNAKISYEINGN